VFQLTLDGKFITEYKSVSKTSKHTGCNKTNIGEVCRGERKRCGGYLWRYNIKKQESFRYVFLFH
jgi:hypothetical protein